MEEGDEGGGEQEREGTLSLTSPASHFLAAMWSSPQNEAALLHHPPFFLLLLPRPIESSLLACHSLHCSCAHRLRRVPSLLHREGHLGHAPTSCRSPDYASLHSHQICLSGLQQHTCTRDTTFTATVTPTSTLSSLPTEDSPCDRHWL